MRQAHHRGDHGTIRIAQNVFERGQPREPQFSDARLGGRPNQMEFRRSDPRQFRPERELVPTYSERPYAFSEFPEIRNGLR